MTQAERCRYVHVVNVASTQQPWKSCYDQLIQIHRVQFNSGIHLQPAFLPWHRWFILALENLLRQVDCHITVPYWDWSLEPQTWQNSMMWAVQCGLGGNGDPSNSDYVSTGTFRQTNWQLTPSANQNFMQRRFNGALPDCASVAMIQRLGIAEFNTWHNFVSSNLHDAVQVAQCVPKIQPTLLSFSFTTVSLIKSGLTGRTRVPASRTYPITPRTPVLW